MSYHEQCIKCKGDCCDGVGVGEMCRNCLKEEIKYLRKAPTWMCRECAGQWAVSGREEEVK